MTGGRLLVSASQTLRNCFDTCLPPSEHALPVGPVAIERRWSRRTGVFFRGLDKGCPRAAKLSLHLS